MTPLITFHHSMQTFIIGRRGSFDPTPVAEGNFIVRSKAHQALRFGLDAESTGGFGPNLDYSHGDPRGD